MKLFKTTMNDEAVDNKQAPRPRLIADEAVRRLNIQGYGEHIPLKTINEARGVMERMPEGKNGISSKCKKLHPQRI